MLLNSLNSSKCVDENGRQVLYDLPVYIYVSGIGDKSLPIHSNKNTGKVTTPTIMNK